MARRVPGSDSADRPSRSRIDRKGRDIRVVPGGSQGRLLLGAPVDIVAVKKDFGRFAAARRREMSGQFEHELLPQTTHDELARQSFVHSLKVHLASHVSPGNKKVYEQRVKPRS